MEVVVMEVVVMEVVVMAMTDVTMPTATPWAPTPDAPAPGPSHPAILRRRRMAAGVLVVVLAVALLVTLRAVLGLLGGGSLTAPERASAASVIPAGQSTYVVRAGDTLWSIANRLHPGEDPRPVVDHLASEAGGTNVEIGQRIRVPGRP